MNFIADNISLDVSKESIDNFFKDINALKLIMPAGVEQWQAEGDKCSFFIKNLGNLKMKRSFDIPVSEYAYRSTANSKVDFTLLFHFNENGQNKSTGYFELQAQVNPFMKMMLERPVTNFVNLLTQNLHNHFKNKCFSF